MKPRISLLAAVLSVLAAPAAAQMSDALEAFAAETARQSGYMTAASGIRGKTWFTEGVVLGDNLVALDGVELAAQGAGVTCAGGSVLALGPLFGAPLGAALYKPCGDLVRLGAELLPEPPDPRRDLTAVMRELDLNYGDFPAPDLRYASREQILDYRISLHEGVIEADLAAQRQRGGSSMANQFLSEDLAALKAQKGALSGAGNSATASPPVDPSDASPGTGSTPSDLVAGRAGSAPDPRDLPAVIDWVLEGNDCTATEAEIFEAIESRTDLWTANQAIRFWTESDGFDANYTYRREGETGIYTMTSGEVCGNRTPEAPGDLSRAGEWLVSQAISAECGPAGGRFAPEDIHRRDLDGDGQTDLMLDHAGVTCNSGMPMSCGAQVCTSEIFLRRGSLLEKAAEYHAIVAGIGQGNRPAVRLYPHGGAEYEVVWSGTGFSRR